MERIFDNIGRVMTESCAFFCGLQANDNPVILRPGLDVSVHFRLRLKSLIPVLTYWS